MANIELNVVALGNFKQLESQLAALKVELASVNSALASNQISLSAKQVRGLSDAFHTSMMESGQFTSKLVSMSTAAQNLGQRIAKGRTNMADFKQAMQSVSKETSLYNQLGQRQVAMQQAVIQNLGNGMARVYAQHHVDLSSAATRTRVLTEGIIAQNAALKASATHIVNWGKNTQWAGRQLTAGLTMPIALFAAGVAKMFNEVDQNLTKLEKVYGVGLQKPTKEMLANVRKDVLGLSKELGHQLGITAAEVTDTAAQFAAAGLTGSQLLDATKQASRIVVLGETDKQEAIKATIALQTAYKLNNTELTESVNFFNAAQAATSTSMADLVEAVPRVGPVIKGLGGSYKDMVAILTALKEGGVPAGEAANAIKTSLGRLINPTEAAQKRLSGFGIDINNIVTKNAGNLVGMITSLQGSLDKLSSLDRQKAIAELFGKFQFARMTALMDNFGKTGTQSAKVIEMMGMSAADLASIADEQTKKIQQSASGKFKIAVQDLKNTLLPLGEGALKTFSGLINAVTGFFDAIGNLPGPIKTIMKAFGAIAVIAGPIIMITGLFGNLIGMLGKGLVNFRSLFTAIRNNINPLSVLGQKFQIQTEETVAAANAEELFGEKLNKNISPIEAVTNAILAQVEALKMLQSQMTGTSSAATMSSATMAAQSSAGITAGYSRSGGVHHLIPYSEYGYQAEQERMRQRFANETLSADELKRLKPHGTIDSSGKFTPGANFDYSNFSIGGKGEVVSSSSQSKIQRHVNTLAARVSTDAQSIQEDVGSKRFVYSTDAERKEIEQNIIQTKSYNAQLEKEYSILNRDRLANGKQELSIDEKRLVEQRHREQMFFELIYTDKQALSLAQEQVAFNTVMNSGQKKLESFKQKILQIQGSALSEEEKQIQIREQLTLAMQDSKTIQNQTLKLEQEFNAELARGGDAIALLGVEVGKIIETFEVSNIEVRAAFAAVTEGKVAELKAEELLTLELNTEANERKAQRIARMQENAARANIAAQLKAEGIERAKVNEILGRLSASEMMLVEQVQTYKNSQGQMFAKLLDAEGKLIASYQIAAEEVVAENGGSGKPGKFAKAGKIGGGIGMAAGMGTMFTGGDHAASQSLMLGSMGMMMTSNPYLQGASVAIAATMYAVTKLNEQSAKLGRTMTSAFTSGQSEADMLGFKLDKIGTLILPTGTKKLDEQKSKIDELTNSISNLSAEDPLKSMVDSLKSNDVQTQVALLQQKYLTLRIQGVNDKEARDFISAIMRAAGIELSSGAAVNAAIGDQKGKNPLVQSQTLGTTLALDSGNSRTNDLARSGAIAGGALVTGLLAGAVGATATGIGAPVGAALALAAEVVTIGTAVHGLYTEINSDSGILKDFANEGMHGSNSLWHMGANADRLRKAVEANAKTLNTFISQGSLSEMDTQLKELQNSMKGNVDQQNFFKASVKSLFEQMGTAGEEVYNKMNQMGVSSENMLSAAKLVAEGFVASWNDVTNLTDKELTVLVHIMEDRQSTITNSTDTSIVDKYAASHPNVKTSVQTTSGGKVVNPGQSEFDSTPYDKKIKKEQDAIELIKQEREHRQKILEAQKRGIEYQKEDLEYQKSKLGLQNQLREALASGDLLKASELRQQIGVQDVERNQTLAQRESDKKERIKQAEEDSSIKKHEREIARQENLRKIAEKNFKATAASIQNNATNVTQTLTGAFQGAYDKIDGIWASTGTVSNSQLTQIAEGISKKFNIPVTTAQQQLQTYLTNLQNDPNITWGQTAADALKPLLDAQEKAAVQLAFINLRQNQANKSKSNEELEAQAIQSVLNSGAQGGATVTYSPTRKGYIVKRGGKSSFYGATTSVDGAGSGPPTDPPTGGKVQGFAHHAGDWVQDPTNPKYYWQVYTGDNYNTNIGPHKMDWIKSNGTSNNRTSIMDSTGHQKYWLSSNGSVTRVATGGYIMGPGSGISDSIPAMLSNGEFVVKASSVAKYGTPMLDAINTGHYAMGGYVVPTAKYADGGLAGNNATISAIFNISGPDAGEVADQAIKKLELMMKKNGAVTRI